MRFMGVLRMWCVLQRWNARLRLLDSRGFVEAQPRRTREDAGRVALAEVDEEVGLDGRALEEGLVDLRVVEARHRSGVEAERARGQDQVGALQAAVAERRLAAAIAGAVEPALGVGMREPARQLPVEIPVADDRKRAASGKGGSDRV